MFTYLKNNATLVLYSPCIKVFVKDNRIFIFTFIKNKIADCRGISILNLISCKNLNYQAMSFINRLFLAKRLG